VSWNAEQLRILRAMGHEPMQLVGAAFGREESGEVLESRPKAAPTKEGVGVALLQAAIARAAGGRDFSALALDLERLRREPALKRALWPQLRALRRGH
jgi:hypothetical protein